MYTMAFMHKAVRFMILASQLAVVKMSLYIPVTSRLQGIMGMFSPPSSNPGTSQELGDYRGACSQLANLTGLSSGTAAVYYPGSREYKVLVSHWAGSSSQASACVVEPKTPSDVGHILNFVGETRTPFSVKSGGHSTNPGFSSTGGIHISLNAFRSIEYDATSQTVEIGSGLRWEDVYAALEPYGVNVLGGRVPDVGVGGFTLGGGYSWKANQYGLAVDTVVGFELVKPNGDFFKVTEESDPQLFFGLKACFRGGLNNFGVVTKITFKTFPQGQVWGGNVMYMRPSSFSAVGKATVKFSAKITDPKASIFTTFGNFLGMPMVATQFFYDGPTPPAGTFDDFLAIPSFKKSVYTRSFLSLVKDSPSNLTYGLRAHFHAIPVPEYSPKFVELLANLSASLGEELTPRSLVYLGLTVEPFLPTIISHTDSPTAFPYTREKMYTPFNIFVTWSDPGQDAVFKAAVENITDTLYDALAAEGHTDAATAPVYPNYAIWDTPLERIYGSNLPALKELKARVDPLDVMGLAGGFKLILPQPPSNP